LWFDAAALVYQLEQGGAGAEERPLFFAALPINDICDAVPF
jgi:hypothetical protein